MKVDRRTAIIALTHDPKLDDLALLEAVRTNAFFVGAIGSRRNAQKRRERLQEHFGITPYDLARLRSPVGLFIASKTPPEIAVCIMTVFIAVKNSCCVANRQPSGRRKGFSYARGFSTPI